MQRWGDPVMARSAASLARNARYHKERYNWLKENGFCIECGSNYNEPGYVFCKACRQKDIQRHKRADPTGEKMRAYGKKLRAVRKAAGLCVVCGKPMDKAGTRCKACTAKRSESEKVKRMEKRLFQIPIVGISTK